MLILVYAIGYHSSPEHLDRPAGAADEPDDDEDLQHEAHADRLDVVHPDVAHADPDVLEQARAMTTKVSTFIHCAAKMPAQPS